MLLSAILIVGFSTTSWSQRKKKKDQKSKVETPKPLEKHKKGAIQPYEKVITKKAKTDEGLFKVHFVDDKYLYEIPDSLLEREMLMVTRIAKNTSNNRSFGGQKQTLKFYVGKRKIKMYC